MVVVVEVVVEVVVVVVAVVAGVVVVVVVVLVVVYLVVVVVVVVVGVVTAMTAGGPVVVQHHAHDLEVKVLCCAPGLASTNLQASMASSVVNRSQVRVQARMSGQS